MIQRRWFRWQFAWVAVVCLGFDASLLYSAGEVLGSGRAGEMLFTFLLSVTFVAGVNYVVLAELFNRTTIRVADGWLTIRHGPVPWPGAVDVAVSDLRQLYLRRHYRGSKRGESHTWEVHAETTDEASVELVRRLRDPAQAEYLEWAIEEHLGIEDDPQAHALE